MKIKKIFYHDFKPNLRGLKIIGFSDVLILIMTSDDDLLDLLISKKSNLLSRINLNAELGQINNNFNTNKAQDLIIIDRNANESSRDDETLAYYNNLIIEQYIPLEANFFLDYNKSKNSLMTITRKFNT